MRLVPALAAAAVPVLVAGCTTAVPTATTSVLGAAHLRPFDSCPELLGYFQEHALELVGPYGLGGNGGWAVEDAGGETAARADASGMQYASASPEHSTTNTQETGVDEADIVKTDGRIIVTSQTRGVRVVDAASGRILSRVNLPVRGENGAELLLNGTDLVVLATEWGQHGAHGPADTRPAFTSTRTVVTRVDLSDPASPVTLGSVRVEGSYRSARMIGDSVRLVMVSEPPGLAFHVPENGSLQAEEEAEAANRRVIEASTIEDWLPHRQVLDATGEVQDTDRLLGCTDVSRPREASGLSTLSVLTLDVSSASVEPTSAVGLVATGDTVYASTDRLVVATSPWSVWSWGWSERFAPEDLATDLHTFDISDPERTAYVASGTVEGRLVNQFAVDEQDGVIRVATTTDAGPGSSSQSSLLVLREDADALAVTGRVDGLGVTEQIHSVRYLGADLAAVVTFRQVDPLYLIDTSDPTRPRVLGELKVPGYSAYLHPLGDDLLLGIGQDADVETGATHGLQASLFDISDPTDPRRVDQVSWPNATSTVEWDHRAFLHWPTTGQVFLPGERWSADLREGDDAGPEDLFTGVLTVDVDGQRLVEGPSGSTAPENSDWGDLPLRTLVVGEDLWALTYQGLYRFDLHTMEREDVVDLT